MGGKCSALVVMKLKENGKIHKTIIQNLCILPIDFNRESGILNTSNQTGGHSND